MGMLILLLCSLPPLAIVAVAMIHGLKTGGAGTVSALVVSAVILTASALLPFAGDQEQIQRLRFTPSDAESVAANRADDDLIRLTRRWGQDEAYR